MKSTPCAPTALERHLSRLVIEELPDGTVRRHPLSLVELRRDPFGTIISAETTPFRAETPGTLYHDTPITLIRSASGEITLEN